MQIKRLFHKKIHPETSTATKDLNGFSRYETKKILKNSGHSYADSALSCESNRMGCWGTLMKEENCHSKTDMKLSQDAITKNRTIGLPKEMSGAPGWEHWINTDADCKFICIITGLQHILSTTSHRECNMMPHYDIRGRL